MTRDEVMQMLRAGRSSEWNDYRERNSTWIPDLSGLDLGQIDFVPRTGPPFNLSRALLLGTKFPDLPYKLVTPAGQIDLKDALIDVDTKFPKDFNPLSLGAKFVSKSEGSTRQGAGQTSVFISYAWADEQLVAAVDQWLRLKGVGTRIDKRDFFAGVSIRNEILRVMRECDAVLVFYSQASQSKPWPEFERELAADLEMEARKEGKVPPRIIYVVIDNTPLPDPTSKNRLGIMAKGKRFELVCEEIYHGILQIPRVAETIDLSKWSDYTF